MDVARRLDRLRSSFDEAGCDALLVTNLTNVRYLVGFTGSACSLLVRGDDALLLTDGRYATQSSEQLAAAGVVGVDVTIGAAAEQQAALVAAASGVRRLGLEAGHATWAAQRGYASALPSGVELVA